MKRLIVALIVALTTVSADATFFYRQAWNPTALGASVLSARWSAKDHGSLMTDDGAGLISQWVDSAGAMAVTATTTARPTWSATSFNSAYPGVTFDGSANTMVSTTLTTLPTGSTAGEIWVLGNFTTSGSLGIMAGYGGTAGSTFRAIRKSTVDLSAVTDGTVTIAGASVTGNHILMGDWSGTTETGYLDGTVLSGAPGTIASLNTSTTRLRIGASTATSAASFLLGVISEVIIITGQLSASDRQKLEGYLAWQGGLAGSLLPVTHLYRWAPP